MSVSDELGKVHDELIEAVKGLNAADLDRPKTIGEWSIRNVILHIAMWNGEVLKALSIWRSGGKVDWAYVGNQKNILKFNESWMSVMGHLSSKKVLEMYESIHKAMIADVSSMTPARVKKLGGMPKWLHEIVISHTKHHTRKIAAYRKTLGK